jgi:hypothetical protein
MSDNESGRFSWAKSSRKSRVRSTIFDMRPDIPLALQTSFSGLLYQSRPLPMKENHNEA